MCFEDDTNNNSEGLPAHKGIIKWEVIPRLPAGLLSGQWHSLLKGRRLWQKKLKEVAAKHQVGDFFVVVLFIFF